MQGSLDKAAWSAVSDSKGNTQYLPRGAVDHDCYKGPCKVERDACLDSRECASLINEDTSDDVDPTSLKEAKAKDAVYALVTCAGRAGCFADEQLKSAGGTGKCSSKGVLCNGGESNDCVWWRLSTGSLRRDGLAGLAGLW